LYEPTSDATIASSKGTPIDSMDASMKSRSVFDRIASFQPRSRSSASPGGTSGWIGQPGKASPSASRCPGPSGVPLSLARRSSVSAITSR